jgi:hypothetical protein
VLYISDKRDREFKDFIRNRKEYNYLIKQSSDYVVELNTPVFMGYRFHVVLDDRKIRNLHPKTIALLKYLEANWTRYGVVFDSKNPKELIGYNIVDDKINYGKRNWMFLSGEGLFYVLYLSQLSQNVPDEFMKALSIKHTVEYFGRHSIAYTVSVQYRKFFRLKRTKEFRTTLLLKDTEYQKRLDFLSQEINKYYLLHVGYGKLTQREYDRKMKRKLPIVSEEDVTEALNV